jgi:hypothetical protein
MKFLVHQVWAVWFILRKWVWDANMPVALVVDEMGLGKTVISVAAAMICKLLTEDVVRGLQLSIGWSNTLAGRVNVLQKDFHRIFGDEWEWAPLQRHHSVPRRLILLQCTSLQGYPAIPSGY